MHDWHPMLLKVFALASHTKISQRETTDLCSVLMKSNINSMDAFAALDGPTLKGMVRRMLTSDGWDCDRCMHIHRILERARMHPSVDHDGSFARLFHQVSRSLVADRPWMTHLPPNLLRFISACPDTSESDHLTGIAACMIQDRLVVGAGRERPRVVASCAHSLLRVVQVIVRLDPTAKFSEWLPRNASLSHLVAIAAKLMAFLNRRVYGRSHGTTHRIRTQAEVMLQHVTLMVRCGVFEPHTPVGAVLPMRQLHAKMFQLENSQPELYAATAQPHALWSKPELTTETLERLFTVARTCEEKAYLQLSAITGLRAGAIANLRLRAVWDAVKQEVVTVIAAMEKNSDLRRISTEAFPSLRSALHAFIVSNERQAAGGGPYLFPNRRCATVPSRGFASQTLRRLCRRANLPAHHHHQWRRMIVNTHMQRNGRLEDVAKWLGHRSPAITFAQRYFFLLFLQKKREGKGSLQTNHYWTDPALVITTAPAPGLSQQQASCETVKRGINEPEAEDSSQVKTAAGEAMHLVTAFEVERETRQALEERLERVMAVLTPEQRLAVGLHPIEPEEPEPNATGSTVATSAVTSLHDIWEETNCNHTFGRSI